MPQPNALLIRAVREVADSFNDALQVILLEVAHLRLYGGLSRDEAEHLARLSIAADKAAMLSRIVFGFGANEELGEATQSNVAGEESAAPGRNAAD